MSDKIESLGQQGSLWPRFTLLTLTAYLLSMVVIDWLTNHGYMIAPTGIDRFYRPIRWIMDRLPEEVFQWYITVVT